MKISVNIGWSDLLIAFSNINLDITNTDQPMSSLIMLLQQVTLSNVLVNVFAKACAVGSLLLVIIGKWSILAILQESTLVSTINILVAKLQFNSVMHYSHNCASSYLYDWIYNYLFLTRTMERCLFTVKKKKNAVRSFLIEQKHLNL